MIQKSVKRFVFILVISITATFGICGPGMQDKEKNGERNAVIGRYEEAIVCAECVENEAGAVLGFRFNLLNSSDKEKLILLIDDESFSPLSILVYNATGMPVSPDRPKFQLRNTGSNTRRFRYDPVRPRGGRTWFIPLPRQVKVDPRIFDDPNNLKPIESGIYKVRMKVGISYFMWGREMEAVPEFPDTQYMEFEFPKITIEVDQGAVGQDVFDAWVLSRGGALVLEAGKREN